MVVTVLRSGLCLHLEEVTCNLISPNHTQDDLQNDVIGSLSYLATILPFIRAGAKQRIVATMPFPWRRTLTAIPSPDLL